MHFLDFFNEKNTFEYPSPKIVLNSCNKFLPSTFLVNLLVKHCNYMYRQVINVDVLCIITLGLQPLNRRLLCLSEAFRSPKGSLTSEIEGTNLRDVRPPNEDVVQKLIRTSKKIIKKKLNDSFPLCSAQ